MLASLGSRLFTGLKCATSTLAANSQTTGATNMMAPLINGVGPLASAARLQALELYGSSRDIPPKIDGESSAASAGTSGTDAATSPLAEAASVQPSTTTSDSTSQPSASASPTVSRHDKSASVDTIYPSSQDDNMLVQRNWFNSLINQLNVVHRTGMVPHMKGRQREIFVSVEREFESLWERHVRGKGLEGTAHRGMLLCCLAIATHRVLTYESGDDELVKNVITTNLGGMGESALMRLHKARLWVLLRLLAEEPFKEATRFLPHLQGDLGSLVQGQVDVSPEQGEATWTATRCELHAVLSGEEATELLPEFCCQHGMQWLEAFTKYGLRVGLEQSLGFGDECCRVRISRPGGGDRGEGGGPTGWAPSPKE